MNKNITTTKKGMSIILILYSVGLATGIRAALTYNMFEVAIAICLVIISVLLALTASVKPVGWMGMTKEKIT